MQVTSFINFAFTSIAAIMIIYLKFAAKASYFERVGEQNGVYPAQFPTGPAGMRLREEVPLVKFSGNISELTSLLTTVQTLVEMMEPDSPLVVDHQYHARHLVPYVSGIMMDEPKRTWRAVVSALGALNNLTLDEFKEAIQDFTSDVFGKANLGDLVFRQLDKVKHRDLMSRNFVNQLMEPKPIFEELKKYLTLSELLETSNGVPAIDSYETKLAYAQIFSPHARDWVENNVEDAQGANLDLNADDGVTAEELEGHFSTYYFNNLNYPGARTPNVPQPRLLLGDGSQRGNGNPRRRGRDNDDDGGRPYQRRRPNGYSGGFTPRNGDFSNGSGGGNNDRRGNGGGRYQGGGNNSNRGGGYRGQHNGGGYRGQNNGYRGGGRNQGNGNGGGYRGNGGGYHNNGGGRPNGGNGGQGRGTLGAHRPRRGEVCPLHGIHTWWECEHNPRNRQCRPYKCYRTLDSGNAPQWFIEDCRLLPPRQQQQRRPQQQQPGQQYQFSPPAGLPPAPVLAAPGGSYVYQPAVNPPPPATISAPGGSYVYQPAVGAPAAPQQQQRGRSAGRLTQGPDGSLTWST